MAGTLTEALAVLESIFELPKPRREKCAALYQLARDARGGFIVELGTYHGNGAIALALGTRDGCKLPVYTIDDYQQRQGWANEPYGPEDERIFWANIEKANVQIWHVQRPIERAVKKWEAGIALLHWDLGMMYRMVRDFWSWEPHVIEGGVMAVHDTFSRTLGSERLEAEVKERGGWGIEQLGGGLWAFRKPSTV